MRRFFMNIFIIVPAVFMIAMVLGIGSFALIIAIPCESTFVNNGPWQTDLSVGSEQTGLYTKARIAIMGLFALKKTEAVYFIARTDSEGKSLDSGCEYRIEGSDLPARWWSVTALGQDFHLIPNEAGRYSFNRANVARAPDRGYVIRLSSKRKEGNWLPAGSPDRGRIILTLRLYGPEAAVLEKPGGIELPGIVREGCR